MRVLTILKQRLRTLFERDRIDLELDEELQYHLDRQIEQNLQAGMPPGLARTAALRLIGGPTQIQEQCRDERGLAWLTDFLRDIRYGFRSFRREPVFVIAIVVTLGLGIGANTAVFSVADELLLKGLPVRQPERLFQVLQPDGPGLQQYGDLFAAADYAAMRDRAGQFAELAAETEAGQVTARTEGAQEEVLNRGIVSGNYFLVLGIDAVIGRTISSVDDHASGQSPIAVISYGFWQRRFDLDRQILGRTIRIGNTIFQIVGVAQPGFFGIDVGTMTDLWTPLASEPLRPRSIRSVRLIGQLNRGSTMAQASAPLQAILHRQMVDMVGHRHAPIADYSKGMKQRVLISAALMHNPDVLILDEPLSGIDVVSAQLFKHLLTELAREGKMILYISHVLEVVERVCAKVVIIYRGRIMADDSVENLRKLANLPSLEEIFTQLVEQRDLEMVARDIVSAVRD